LDNRDQLSKVVPKIFQSRKWRLGVRTTTTSVTPLSQNSKTVSNLISAITKAKHVEMAIFQIRANQDSNSKTSEKIDKLITLVSSQVNGLLLILLLNNHKKLIRLDAKANTIQRVERGRSARSETKRYKSFKDFEQKALKVRVLFTLFHKKKINLRCRITQARKDFEMLVSDRQLDLSNRNENIRDSENKLQRADKAHELAHTKTRDLLTEYERSKKEEERLYREHTVLRREVTEVETKIKALKQNLETDNKKLRSWTKEHQSSMKEHRRVLEKCEKEQQVAQKELEKHSKGLDYDHALAKAKTVLARRDSALKIVTRDESELGAYEAKVKVDQAKLKVEESHLKHAKDGVIRTGVLENFFFPSNHIPACVDHNTHTQVPRKNSPQWRRRPNDCQVKSRKNCRNGKGQVLRVISHSRSTNV